MTIRDQTLFRDLAIQYPEESREIIDEVFTGEWVEDNSEGRAPGSHFYCSKCGKMFGIRARIMKYCSECGRRMSIEDKWKIQ